VSLRQVARRQHERTLSEKERCFVDAFMGVCAGNATQAAIHAGYSKNSARRIATRLLSTNVHIHSAIAANAEALHARGIADAVERDTLLSTFARDPRVEIRDRIRAIAELNKCTGRHTVKHMVDGGPTLAELIAGSREEAAS
jgi:phage terminase small subunit